MTISYAFYLLLLIIKWIEKKTATNIQIIMNMHYLKIKNKKDEMKTYFKTF